MTETTNDKRTLRLSFCGLVVNCSFGPLQKEIADYWAGQPTEKFYDHIISMRDDDDEVPDDGTPPAFQLHEWRYIPDARYFEGASEGCSFTVHDDVDEIYSSDEIVTVQRGEEQFFNNYQIMAKGDGAFLAAIEYDGALDFTFEISGKFDPDLLAFDCTMIISTQYITSVTYDGVPMECAGVTGETMSQLVQLYSKSEKNTLKVSRHADLIGDRCLL